MSMLLRFRKKGGFSQLLNLIETCDSVKQKNLLHLVGQEDPGWAHLVRIKCLSVPRIMNWPSDVLSEIAPHIPEKVILSISASLAPDLREKFHSALSPGQFRILEESLRLSTNSSAEFHAASIKLIQIVRDLAEEGKLNFSRFDPTLVIDPSLAA